MIQYVTNKEFLRDSKIFCADLLNQLKQELENDGIIVHMELVGSARRGLITRDGNKSIDYDYNCWIIDDGDFVKGKDLKENIMDAFNHILKKNVSQKCHVKDSTSVITTPLFKHLAIPFRIDLCIVKEENGHWHRLIHQKTGFVQADNWIWNIGPDSSEMFEKEEYLKPEHWQEIKDSYLERKKMYLTGNIYKPSFICYIEVINELYDKYTNNSLLRSVRQSSYGFYSINGSSGFYQ